MSLDERILILAPQGRDRQLLADALLKSRHEPKILESHDELLRELSQGAGALLLEEEALDERSDPLIDRLRRQPPWSDLPVIVLTAQSRLERQTRRMLDRFGPAVNLVLLERPLRVVTLLHSIESALRARRRQYEVRDLHRGLESRVAERTGLLEAALREMNAFSYTIAHDLRAPLRALHGYGEILESDYGGTLPEEGLTYIRQIRHGAARMEGLIQDLLRYSRLARADVRLGPVDLRNLVRRVMEDLGPDISDRSVEVVVELSERRVVADAVLLGQALNNLISNATKFVKPGTSPRVVVRDEIHDEWVRIVVEDNGIGIAPRHHERIFQVFERLHGLDEYPGTGIGLAIVKRVVERMGGRLGLDSSEGRGSRFWIEQRAVA